jgi:capsular exopolysaccharide synthesis family protein
MTNLETQRSLESGREVRNTDLDDAYPGERLYGARTDPLRLMAVLRAGWRLFAGVAAGVFIVAVIITMVMPRMYTASSNIVLESAAKLDPNSTTTAAATPADSATVDTEAQLIKSRDLADQVVTALQLDQDPAFWSGSHHKPPSSPERAHDAAVSIVHAGLAAKRSGLTSVINVAFTSRNPALAARIANGFAEQYLIAQAATKESTAKLSGKSLTEKLASLRDAAVNAEAAVAQFRNAHGLYTDAGATLTQQQVAAYDQQTASARSELSAYEARLAIAKTQLASGDLSNVAVDSPVIQQLRNQRASITARIADLRTHYGDRYPEVLNAESQLSDVDAQIRAEIQRIMSELNTRVQVARQQVGALQSESGRGRSQLVGATSASVQLAELQRTATAARSVYETYLAKSQQTNALVGTEIPDARIASKADKPSRPSSPNIPLNLALGLVLALAAGSGALYVRESIHPGLLTGDDVERKLGLLHLASIPQLSSVADRADAEASPIDYIIQKPLSSFSEAIRGLRASMRFVSAGKEGQPRVIAFTSALPNEGKSTTSLCLARSAGQAGVKVVLVDCDTRKRGVNALLKVTPSIGIREVLTGTATLNDALIFDEASGAWVLPIAPGSNSGEEGLFEGPNISVLLRDLTSRFDLVILDTAPVLAVAETRLLVSKADAVVFLAHWRKTPEKAIISALKLLDGAGAAIAGVALTQVNMRLQARYGYGDASYYYSAYSNYYSNDDARQSA